MREFLVNKLSEEGKNTALDRMIKEWRATGNTSFGKGSMFQYDIVINKDAFLGMQAVNEILEGQANIGNLKAQEFLNNEKAKVVYQEMLNNIMHAEADRAKANAMKLATDYNVGEYINWKQILEMGLESVNVVGWIIVTGKQIGRAHV